MKKRPGKAHLYKNNIFIRAENSSVTQWFTIRIFFNFWQDGFRLLAPTHIHQSEHSGFKTFPISLDISGFERNETITCRLSQKLILVSLH